MSAGPLPAPNRSKEGLPPRSQRRGESQDINQRIPLSIITILLVGVPGFAGEHPPDRPQSRSAVIEGIISGIDQQGASRKAVSNASEVVRAMFERLDITTLNSLGNRGLKITILHPGDLKANLTPIPNSKKPTGVPPGGRAKASRSGKGPITLTVNEANLLPTEDLPPVPEGFTREPPLGTFVHELAHAVDFAGPPQTLRHHSDLFQAQHARKGLFPTKYSSLYVMEYWAEMTAVYFGVKEFNQKEGGPRVPSARGFGEAWIMVNAPDTYSELNRLFGAPQDLSLIAGRSRSSGASRTTTLPAPHGSSRKRAFRRINSAGDRN